LIDQELSIVFYDLTTIRTEGGTELRRGAALRPVKDGGIVRQVMLGVVQTAEGLPIHHEVFAGNSGETTTLVPTIEKVLARYPIKRVVLVADRGLLSLDNLEAIRALRVGDQPLEFILAVPARRYGDFDRLLASFHEKSCRLATEEVFGEEQWQGFRLIVAHRPDQASEQGRVRDERLAALEADAAQWAEKLDAQEAGQTHRAGSCRTAGTTARFYKAVAEAHLAHIIKVNLSSEVFTYEIDQRALQRARLMDGKLILVSNVPDLLRRDRGALQGAGRHRTGISCPEVGDRDRAGLPPPAGSYPRACADLLPGTAPLSRAAPAPESQGQPFLTGACLGNRSPDPVPPGHAASTPVRVRPVRHHPSAEGVVRNRRPARALRQTRVVPIREP
jgi:hypothetical protein